MSSLTNISALYKRRYGPFIHPLANENTIADYAGFIPQNVRPGENYNFPVEMSLEHGVTHNRDGSAFTLNSVVDSVVVNAQLDGSEILLAGNTPYRVISKAMHGDSAYEQAMDGKVDRLMRGGELYREANLLYGCGSSSAASANVGVINASISGADLGTPQVVSITRATWSAGFWNHMINALVDIVQTDGSTSRETDVSVTAVVAANNRITLDKSGSSATAAATDIIVLRGARTKSCEGLQAILENTGTIFSIAAGTYPQWQALSFSAGSAALTLAKIHHMASLLAQNGLTTGGKLFVNAATFADVANEFTSRERYNNPPPGAKRTGTSNISLDTSCGVIDVAIHTYMKQGIAMFLAEGVTKRVGSTDLTFSLPGTNRWFYQELATAAGCQIRIYSDQAPVIEVPYQCAIVTSIQSSADTTP